MYQICDYEASIYDTLVLYYATCRYIACFCTFESEHDFEYWRHRDIATLVYWFEYWIN